MRVCARKAARREGVESRKSLWGWVKKIFGKWKRGVGAVRICARKRASPPLYRAAALF